MFQSQEGEVGYIGVEVLALVALQIKQPCINL